VAASNNLKDDNKETDTILCECGVIIAHSAIVSFAARLRQEIMRAGKVKELPHFPISLLQREDDAG